MKNEIKKARELVFANEELAGRINKLLNRKNWSIHPAELRVLAKRIKAVLQPVYVGPTKGVYLQGDAIMRLAAKRDAETLARHVGQAHKKDHPHLYSK